MSKKLVLIDGHSIVNRAFFGVRELTNSAGMPTNAIYGFLNILFRILDEEKPDYLVVAFDLHAPTFRHNIYPEYKGTRKTMADELRVQIPVLQELLDLMGICRISIEGLEADDILGTLAKKAQGMGLEVSLISGDRDLLQIADSHIKIRIPKTKAGQTTIEDYFPDDVMKTYGVSPSEFIHVKALMGDSSDNIPGLPKVGEKTAINLISTYHSIEGVYDHLSDMKQSVVKESIAANRELADLCLFLVTIKTDCDIEWDEEAFAVHDFFTPASYELIKKLEFRNLYGKYEKQSIPVVSNMIPTAEVLDSADAFFSRIPKQTKIGLSFLSEDGEVYGIGASFKEGDRTKSIVYISFTGIPSGLISEGLQKVSFDLLSVCDIKNAYGFMNLQDSKGCFDPLIAAYVLNPLQGNYDFSSVASAYLNMTIPARNEVIGKKTVAELILSDEASLINLCCSESYIAYASEEVLKKSLEETNQYSLYMDIEMPLSYVLYDMEKNGVCIRRDALLEFGNSLNSRIAELEKLIYEQAGCEFSILSPKQLGEILFEKLQLPGGKKTKTGYSTAADVLEKLSDEHPIVSFVLEYRGLTKLKSTYADGLAGYIGADERIHTHFMQMVTATGRLSSTEPNLQNIPIRTKLGRELRKVFVGEGDNILIDADYSQIELRLLAALSEDESLIDAYLQDADIHRITASKVFGVPLNEVSNELRSNAKAVNFGIVYGISSFGLSQGLSISKKTAEEYIKQYFETYPGIENYLNRMVTDAKENGFSCTYFGRRRPIPELKSSNFMQRSFGERVAMNAPIQGTAADIIKIAMISVHREMKERNLKSKMVLQVHDELLIEAVPEEVDVVSELLERNMKNAVAFAVPLEVSLSTGRNWFEAH